MAYKILEHLAQSFIVEENSILTKLNLYFSAKDQVLPLYLHIVKNENGLPGSVKIPFSEKYVYPSDVTVGDGSDETTVTFESPVYLESGEYSLCLGTSSNKYKVYCSEVGAIDDLSDNVINEQPYVGVLYKSENSKLWQPVLDEDLKFDLYRAVFDTSSSTNIDLKLDDGVRSGLLGMSFLKQDPLEIYPSNNTIKVYHENHGMTDGSYVSIRGIENGTYSSNGAYKTLYGIDMAELASNNITITNVTSDSYTVQVSSNTSGITETTRFGGKWVGATDNYRYDVVIPGTKIVKDVDGSVVESVKKTSTSYSVDSSFTTLADGDNELSSPAIIAGFHSKAHNMSDAESITYRINISTDNQYTSPIVDLQQSGLILVQNVINNPTYASENLLEQDVVTLVSANSLTITQSTSNTLFGSIAVPAVAQNTALTFTKGTHLTLSGGSALNTGKFRIVDIADDGSTIDVENVAGSNTVTDTADYTITNGKYFVDDRAATGSTSKAQYITRKVDFKNPSTSINLRLDVNRPSGSNIELYYKTKLVGEEIDLNDKEFIRFPHTMPVSLTNEFTEIENQLDNLRPFNQLVFKIVLKSSTTTSIPKCKNLRLIVLA